MSYNKSISLGLVVIFVHEKGRERAVYFHKRHTW